MKGANIMYNFKSLKCCNCNSVMFNLPETEVIKLSGSQFRCECCRHQNVLVGFRLLRTSDKILSYTSINMDNSSTLPIGCM
jgi:hypothetical protein